jgi:flagellar biosynthesis chaperone FliJ
MKRRRKRKLYRKLVGFHVRRFLGASKKKEDRIKMEIYVVVFLEIKLSSATFF